MVTKNKILSEKSEIKLNLLCELIKLKEAELRLKQNRHGRNK